MIRITFKPVPKVLLSCSTHFLHPPAIHRGTKKTPSPQMMTPLTFTCSDTPQPHPHQTWVRNYPSCVKPHFWQWFVKQQLVLMPLMNTACVCLNITMGHPFIWSIHTYLCHCRCSQLSGRFPGACSASYISLPLCAGKESSDCQRS